MTRVDFYHLQKKVLEDVLPTLLLKAYSLHKKIVIKASSEEKVEAINSYLWTYNDESFLPHGSKKDGFAEQQPIFLTSSNENPNHAEFLFLIDGAEETPEDIAQYERVFNIFDGNSAEAVAQARNLWKIYKNAEMEVCYWQQDENGKWTQKA